MSAIIKVSNLSKSFKGFKAVDNLSFQVEQGQVYGFLGQNGAGKSTSIRMLLTLVQPDGGSIEIFGMDLRKHRREILRQTGAVIERPDLYKYLSALQNLQLFAKLSGAHRTTKELMERLAMVGLAERANSRVKTYSQGMKQRLGLACALVHDPGLVILDEPTNGLDPQGIAEMRNLVISLAHEMGKTVFVSSHLLGEMEMMADNLLIIHKGRKVVEGNMRELLNPATSPVEFSTTDNERARRLLETAGAVDIQAGGALRVEMPLEKIPALVHQLVEQGIGIKEVRPLHTLEDYFIAQTKD